MSATLISSDRQHDVLALTAPLEEELSLRAGESEPTARRLLGQELLGANLIDPEQLEAALGRQSKQGQPLGETILEMGILTEEELLPFVEAHLGVPAVRLREGLVDTAAVRLIPPEAADRLGVLGLLAVHGSLTVAMEDPRNLEIVDHLERITGLDVNPVFAFGKSIRSVIQRVYRDDFEVDAVTAELSDGSIELQDIQQEVDVGSIEQLVEGSPVINLVNFLILQAVQQGASDIHVEPGRNYSIVRFRIDGQLVEVLRPRRDIYPAIISRVKVMAKLDIAEQRAPQDGRLQVIADNREIDLRVSTLPTVLGEKVVMRVLDKQRLTFNLDELGIPLEMLSQIKNLLAKPNGLVLVCGPTGSGKTTTLYSALELIKSVHRNIVTVEDPVEYQIELVNQVQVDQNRKVGFADALRSILRQDPDVIMIGEIRDAETAQIAVQAALTGHLVLSTLHTNDAPGAITRMRDMDVEPYKLAAALVGVVAQRLVRKVCPKCRSSHFPSVEYLQLLHYEGDPCRSFSRGTGCRDCFDTGFQGRVGIYEMLSADSRLREMISEQAHLEDVRKWARQRGNQNLLECGLALAEQETTSLEEVARVALFD